VTVGLRSRAALAAWLGFGAGFTGFHAHAYTIQRIDPVVLFDLNATNFPSRARGYAVGIQDILLTTIDGGATWALSRIGKSGPYLDVNFLNDSVGFLVSETAVYRTRSRGVAWETVLTAAGAPFHSLAFASGIGILASHDAAYWTRNEGDTWTKVSFAPFQDARMDLGEVEILPDGTAFIAGRSALFKSPDGGKNWARASEAPPANSVNSLAVSTASEVAIGSTYYGGGWISRDGKDLEALIVGKQIEDIIKGESGEFLALSGAEVFSLAVGKPPVTVAAPMPAEPGGRFNRICRIPGGDYFAVGKSGLMCAIRNGGAGVDPRSASPPRPKRGKQTLKRSGRILFLMENGLTFTRVGTDGRYPVER
jgi:photosystem II stability/assembly factor-like uncharacterized protein